MALQIQTKTQKTTGHDSGELLTSLTYLRVSRQDHYIIMLLHNMHIIT